ncbi:signal peptide peptidase SppA [Arcobacter sp. FWKO B]|nr:signal peptide peptidase SppA [Arcobacter sp. FWKO B]
MFYPSGEMPQRANLATVELSGPIVDSKDILEKIQKVKEDEYIKGVLFVVNSPGGAVAPSVEIAYAIKELKEIKPVVAYASGIMASGGYYASIWSDKIIANPGGMIGSIGVIFQSFNIEELITKIGIQTQTQKIGKYKESGTPFREWNDYEKDEINKVISQTYDMFVSDVSLARGLDPKNHESFADAHIFTSMGAKEVGLIDEVGTLSMAQGEIIKLSGVSDPIWTKEDKFEKFMEKLMQSTIQSVVKYFGSNLKSISDL